MKKGIIILLTGLLFATAGLQSQDLQARLDEAESSYNSGDLENARFALQEALNEINKAIGNDILAILPDELGGIPKVENSDNVTGTNMGFAGLYVNRDFQAEGKDANFQIISDSPLLSSISSMLSLSVFMAADPNQKRIKVDGYKALMTRSENEDGSTYSWDVSLPFGDSMITLQCHGIEDGKTVEKIMNDIPVARIIEIAK
ncbi:MAG: hypothetical protein KDC05_04615 [Bacteroidales bacterium]|nr:hypothetical protein [Bacteroidales bacterium]